MVFGEMWGDGLGLVNPQCMPIDILGVNIFFPSEDLSGTRSLTKGPSMQNLSDLIHKFHKKLSHFSILLKFNPSNRSNKIAVLCYLGDYSVLFHLQKIRLRLSITYSVIRAPKNGAE